MTSNMADWRNLVPYTELSERQQKIMQFLWDWPSSYPPSMREVGEAVALAGQSAVRHQLTQLEAKGWVRRHPRRSRALEWRRPDGDPPVRPELPRTDYLCAHPVVQLDQDQATVDASEDGLPRTVVAKPSPLRALKLKPDEAGKALVSSGSQNMVSMPVFDRIAAGTGVIANPGSHLRQGLQYSEDTMQLPREIVGSGALFAVRVVGDSMVNASIVDGDLVVVRQQDSADEGDIVAALIEEEGTVKTLQYANDHVWLMPQNPAYKPILGDDCRIMGKVVATVHQV
jgi:repressor LexA